MDFVPSVRMHLRCLGHEEEAILLLDNCPAHPGPGILVSKEKKIKAMFLLKNTTSKIQPLNQGIIASLKLLYRRQLIKKMLEDEREVQVYLKSITLKDALFMAADAWDAVKPTTIQHCWEKACLKKDLHSMMMRTTTTSWGLLPRKLLLPRQSSKNNWTPTPRLLSCCYAGLRWTKMSLSPQIPRTSRL